MIVALMMGRAGSRGLKNKNLIKINNKRICEYPLLAAKKSKLVENIYVTTNCPKIKKFLKNIMLKLLIDLKNYVLPKL